MKAVLGWFAGDPEAQHALPELALDLPAALGGEQRVQEATLAVVNTLAPLSTRDRARVALEREHRQWRDRNEPRSAHALWGLAWVEFWAGRWELAAAHAVQAHDISIQYGLEVPQDHLPIALVAVHRGQLELAREHSERALGLADEQFALRPPQHMAILGLVAYWSGDAARGPRLARPGGPTGGRARLERAERPLVDLRLQRAAPGARPGRRCSGGHRRLGRGRAAGRSRVGARPRRLDAAASSQPLRARSGRRSRCCGKRLPSTRRSAIRSAAPGRCSTSASSAGARGRSGRPRRRSRPRSAASRSSAQLAGSRRRRPSSGESADADAKRG